MLDPTGSSVSEKRNSRSISGVARYIESCPTTKSSPVSDFPTSTQAFHFSLFTISRQARIIPNPTLARYIESCQTTKFSSSYWVPHWSWGIGLPSTHHPPPLPYIPLFAAKLRPTNIPQTNNLPANFVINCQPTSTPSFRSNCSKLSKFLMKYWNRFELFRLCFNFCPSLALIDFVATFPFNI